MHHYIPITNVWSCARFIYILCSTISQKQAKDWMTEERPSGTTEKFRKVELVAGLVLSPSVIQCKNSHLWASVNSCMRLSVVCIFLSVRSDVQQKHPVGVSCVSEEACAPPPPPQLIWNSLLVWGN